MYVYFLEIISKSVSYIVTDLSIVTGCKSPLN